MADRDQCATRPKIPRQGTPMDAEQVEVHVERLRRELVGRETEPHTVHVEAGAIAKFARAIGATDPIYYDAEYAKRTRHGAIIAPPTYPSHLMFLLMNARGTLTEFVPGLTRVLHTDDVVESWEPIKAGDTITSTGRCGDVFQRQGRDGAMLFQALDVTQVNQHGRKACVVRMITVQF